MKTHSLYIFCLITVATVLFISTKGYAQTNDYLKNVKLELEKQWPKNRTINLVFHGHSVPSGYFDTPNVHTLEAYPQQVLTMLKARYPFAVINVITTSIGGENSVSGEKRFKRDVLVHKPDVLFIDYALNDRAIGLEASRKATEGMVRQALKKDITVILMCPSPDVQVDIVAPDNVLEQYERQLVALAKKYRIGYVDSYALFRKKVQSGISLSRLMSQSNHPNAAGHQLIAAGIVQKYF